MDLTDLGIEAYLSTWGYPVFAASLAATGIGFPIPEDLLLLAGGSLIASDVFDWSMAIPLGVTGVMAGDGLLFFAGRRLRDVAIGDARVTRLLAPERIRRVTAWFERLGDWVIPVSRFVPGTRAVVFVAAGLRGTSVWRWVALDAVGTLLWVPLVLSVGYRLMRVVQ